MERRDLEKFSEFDKVEEGFLDFGAEENPPSLTEQLFGLIIFISVISLIFYLFSLCRSASHPTRSRKVQRQSMLERFAKSLISVGMADAQEIGDQVKVTKSDKECTKIRVLENDRVKSSSVCSNRRSNCCVENLTDYITKNSQ